MKKDVILSPIDLLITIVNRGMGEKVKETISEFNFKNHIELIGYGTAESEISDLFGFGIKERDIVLSFVESEKSKAVLDKLNEEFYFNERHTGLAFTIPLNSAEKSLVDLLKLKL